MNRIKIYLSLHVDEIVLPELKKEFFKRMNRMKIYFSLHVDEIVLTRIEKRIF
jgi:hypothetical protein